MLVLILLSEALVTALILVEGGLTDLHWQRFAILSFFVQWVALLSVALLCQTRVFMARLSLLLAVIWAMFLLQMICLLVSVGAEFLMTLAIPGAKLNIDWLWVLRNQVISAIFGAMALRYFYVQSQWRLKARAELSSRLQALQARIRPHFFFNSLNTVASLISVDPDKAENMLVDLSSLFRVVLKDQDAQVSLEQEIELGRRYLNIEQTRLGERLRLAWDLPEDIPQIQVPQLLLQPMLENAIYHGIQPLVEGGEIRIALTALQEEQAWILTITNDIPSGKEKSHNGHSVALPNTRMRLDAVYNGNADLETSESHGRYIVRLRLPMNPDTVTEEPEAP